MTTVPESPWIGRGSPLNEVCRHICDFLQWRFSLLPQGAYRFVRKDDGAVDVSSEIHISMDFPINPEIVGARPALTVFRGPAQFQGLSIGDRSFFDFASGAEARADLIPINLMIGVLGRTAWEVEALAWHVLNEISAFRKAIIDSMPDLLYLGRAPLLSPPSPPGAMVPSTKDDWIAVIVSFPTVLSYKHIVTPLNKKIISGMNMTLTTENAIPSAPQPVELFQGTSLMQPTPTISPEGSGGLPQTTQAEANSTEPLSVEIEVR